MEEKINLKDMSEDAQLAILGAQALAEQLKHTEVMPLHLLREVADRGASIWHELNVEQNELIPLVDVKLAKKPRTYLAFNKPVFSSDFRRLLVRAKAEAGGRSVDLIHFILSFVYERDRDILDIWKELSISNEKLRSIAGSPPIKIDYKVEEKIEEKIEPQSKNFKSIELGEISQYTNDLNIDASEGKFDPIIGRASELRRIIQVLSRRTKNNPLLIGESGVGKSTLIKALVNRLTEGDIPNNLKDKHIISLDMGALIAGTKARGEFEQRMRNVINKVKESNGQIILYINQIHNLVNAGGSGGSSLGAADLIKPALMQGEIRCIGITTPEEYRKNFEKDATLTRLFQPIFIDEPSEEDTIAILRAVVGKYELHHGLKISDPSCIAAVKLSQRYVGERKLPDKAIDLIDESAARLRSERDSLPEELDELQRTIKRFEIELNSLADDNDPISEQYKKDIENKLNKLYPEAKNLKEKWNNQIKLLDKIRILKNEHEKLKEDLEKCNSEQDQGKATKLKFETIPSLVSEIENAEKELSSYDKIFIRDTVTDSDIAKVISDWTGIPVTKLMESEAQKLIHMEERLKETVVGQDDALKAVSKAVRRGRVGLRDPRKPIGSFLFLGPTGVGKTELAKALAEFLFDDESAMTRIDMSEFMERHMVARLVGAPPGYADSDQGGYLTEAVRQKPYSVILLDEIEKAHPDVFNLLLQVLDDGRLTDGRGRTVNFTNTVIIMTSNIGGHEILEFEGTKEDLKEIIDDKLKENFRPEFLNRIDDIIIFNRLTKENLKGISQIQIKMLSKLIAENDIKLSISEPALDHLVDLGYDPQFGARPLKRVILKYIQDPLAEKILDNNFKKGETIFIDIDNENKFDFKPLQKI